MLNEQRLCPFLSITGALTIGMTTLLTFEALQITEKNHDAIIKKADETLDKLKESSYCAKTDCQLWIGDSIHGNCGLIRG